MNIREVIEGVVEAVMSGVQDASKNGVTALPPKEIEITMECPHHRVRVLIPVVGKFSKGAALVLAAVFLAGCPAMQGAYATYDAAFDREFVAGHDSVRGDYVEYRVTPRRSNRTDGADGKAAAR